MYIKSMSLNFAFHCGIGICSSINFKQPKKRSKFIIMSSINLSWSFQLFWLKYLVISKNNYESYFNLNFCSAK